MINDQQLIFCTGAPGSKWSGIVRKLATCKEIDNSDCNRERTYAHCNGELKHFGNYFGPGMEYGDFFNRLGEGVVSKEQIVKELDKPYSDGEAKGIRLLKSHAFAYALPFLLRTFPESKFLLVWREDNDCFDWWMEAGGFNIKYPNYSWYQNEERMRQQIALENKEILQFSKIQKVNFKYMSFYGMASELELSWDDSQSDQDKKAICYNAQIAVINKQGCS